MNTDKERLLRLAAMEDGRPIGVGGMLFRERVAKHVASINGIDPVHLAPEKVLFLDIDGVLNSAFVLQEQRRGDAIDRGMVERVNRIIQATGCKIVISSTWRLIHPMGELKALLRQHGLIDVIIDKTPYMISEDNNRGDEIETWLKDHPSVQKFCILDDNSDMSDVINNLVQTTWADGLQDEHVERAIAMLSS